MNTGKDPVRSAHGLPAMDYFHCGSSTGMAAITGSGRFPAPSIPVHGLRPADLPGKPCATSRPASRFTHRNSITWLPPAGPALDAGRCQRKGATGVSMRRWPSGLHHPGETLYVDEELGLDLTNTVYALDSTTIALCLSVFRGRTSRTTKAAVKMHTLPRPAGQHSEFYPHLGWQAARRSCPRYALAGSRSHLRRGSWLRRLCPPLCVAPAGAFFVTRAKSNIDAHRVYRRRRIARPASFATRPSPWTASTPVRITPNFCGASLQDPESGKTLVFITNNFSLPAATICALYKSRWQVELFFKLDQAASSDQAVLRHVGERGEDADLDCRLGLRPRRHRQEAPRPGRLALTLCYRSSR